MTCLHAKALVMSIALNLVATACQQPASPPRLWKVGPPQACPGQAQILPAMPEIPPTFETAVDRLVECLSPVEHARILKETERHYVRDTHMRIALVVRRAWLQPADSPLTANLRLLGFGGADDMSPALFSGVWHAVRGIHVDVLARAACVQAWNQARTSAVLPSFECGDDEAIEAGRRRWESSAR